VAFDVNGDRSRNTRALDCEFDRLSALTSYAVHDLLSSPLLDILLVDRENCVAVAQSGFMTRSTWGNAKNIDAIVPARYRDPNPEDPAALLGLNVVKFGFRKEGRMRVELVEHALDRVLSDTFQIYRPRILILNGTESFFELIGQFFGIVGSGHDRTRPSRTQITTGERRDQDNAEGGNGHPLRL